jgi:hypothetical protein
MPYLRQALTLFLLLFVLALAVPISTSQDNNKTDDNSSQSDNSSDQQSDQTVPSDFLFEHPSILHQKLPNEICFEAAGTAPQQRSSIQLSDSAPILPHVFISGCGLMPRAPALA